MTTVFFCNFMKRQPAFIKSYDFGFFLQG